MTTNIWNTDSWRMLYVGLTQRFGPQETWERASDPGPERADEYHRYLEAFAMVVSAKSAEAVEFQVRFAMPIPAGNEPIMDPSHTKLWAGNVTAALEAGFIRSKTLPTRLLAEPPGNNQRRRQRKLAVSVDTSDFQF